MRACSTRWPRPTLRPATLTRRSSGSPRRLRCMVTPVTHGPQCKNDWRCISSTRLIARIILEGRTVRIMNQEYLVRIGLVAALLICLPTAAKSEEQTEVLFTSPSGAFRIESRFPDHSADDAMADVWVV